MIGLSCTAGAVLALCGQVRGTLERKGLPQKELDGGRVRICLLYTSDAADEL